MTRIRRVGGRLRSWRGICGWSPRRNEALPVLVDWDVVAGLRELPPRTQRAVYARFSQLQETPDLISEFSTRDETGRELDAFIVEGLAFDYWIDFGDRHVKVLAFGQADDRMA